MTTAPAPHQTLLDRQLAMLSQLAEAALDLTLHLKEQALAAEAPERLVTAFGRAARAVRLSITLQAQLIKDNSDAAPKEPETVYIERHFVRPAPRADALTQDAPNRRSERSDRPNHDGPDRETPDQPRTWPVSEILALICKDIDLEADVAVLIEDAILLKKAHGEMEGWRLALPPNLE